MLWKRVAVLIILTAIHAWAQQLPQMRVVDTPRLLRNEMVGSQHRDDNNRIAAAIKVISDMEGFTYQSNNGIVEVEHSPGVDMVYLQPDERVLEIYKSGYEPLKVILSEYSIKLESRQVWELKVTGEKKPIGVVIYSNPPNAEKILNGTSLGTGRSFDIPPGTHTLVLKKTGYKSLNRTIKVDDNNKVFDNLTLQEIDIVPVQIKSDPQGATVFIDAIEKGKTDLPLWLYPGDYNMKLTLSGYLDVNKNITVVEGRTNTFNESLVKNSGYLKISIQPADAILTINGKQHTPGNIELVPGTYNLSIIKSGYLSQEETIKLELGESITRSYTLTKNVGTLNINTIPKDAAVIINKQNYGLRRSIELSPGQYRIEVEKDGWYGESETVTIHLGETTSKTYNLKQMTGSLQFSVLPLEATVRMLDATGNVYKSWTGMQYLKDIPVGQYTLECKADKHKTLKREIVITENATEIQELQMEEVSDFISRADMILIKDSRFQMGSTDGDRDEKPVHTVTGSDFISRADMILIKGGRFQMGSTEGDSDEKPVHTVTVSDFYMSKYEVTYQQFEEFIRSTNYKTTAEVEGYSWVWTGSWEKKDGINWRYDVSGLPRSKSESEHPVIHVSWYDAVEYCNYLSRKEGLTPAYMIDKSRKDPNNESSYDDIKWSITWNKNANGYRLPTEAEWEYASGGGASNRTKWSGTNSESSPGNYAWYFSNSGNKTHPVGIKEPNSLGLYDMSGNVWEWCWDWYGDYSSSSQTNPTGPSSGSYRVLRGGSWRSSGATSCRVAYRGDNLPSNRNVNLGFRLVRNAE
jgi:formylglycine-generating enzyme required for sulfatase activity